jgi:hypothetical protein
MNASSQLPSTTSAPATDTAGGIKPPDIVIPSVPAVTGGAQNYENRMAATQSLTQLGSGNLAGGGYRKKRKTIYKRRYNNVTKVMKGCNGKKTRRNKKNKRHNKRVFRGGGNTSPTIIDGKLELNVPLGASGGQIGTLTELTKGLMDLSVQGKNTSPLPPAPVQQKFGGGGITRHRSTKYRRLRYKKSIGRRGRSRRHSGGRR